MTHTPIRNLFRAVSQICSAHPNLSSAAALAALGTLIIVSPNAAMLLGGISVVVRQGMSTVRPKANDVREARQQRRTNGDQPAP